MTVANDVDLVIERNPLASELDEVVSRLVRDLHLSSALCTAEFAGRRQLLAWAGGDPLPFLRGIRAEEGPLAGGWSQVSSPCRELRAAGIGAYVAVPIGTPDITLAGVLWAADAERRWFDHEEIHHLELLARRASSPLQARVSIALDEPTAPAEDRVLSLR